MLDSNFENIPGELKERQQWFGWKWGQDDKGKPTKVPIDAKNGRNGKHNDSKTLATFEKAKRYHESGSELAGIGFCFFKDDPYVGIDLDNCRNTETGEIEPRAQAFINMCATYSEVSPSDTGVKMWLKGEMQGERGIKRIYKTGAVEIYAQF